MEYLKPHNELDTTTGVELAGIPAKEHGEVAVLARRLPLELDNVANILELGLCQTVPFASKTTKDISCFFLASDFDEPPRGFGHSPDNEEEENEGHDLEGDWEAPDEGGIHVMVERGSILDPVSDDDAENVESEFDGDKLTAGCVASGFGGPDRGYGVQDTSSDTVQDTSAKHPLGVLGGALKGGADDSPDGGYGNGQDTAVSIAEPTS